jgi:hypothetical protein
MPEHQHTYKLVLMYLPNSYEFATASFAHTNIDEILFRKINPAAADQDRMLLNGLFVCFPSIAISGIKNDKLSLRAYNSSTQHSSRETKIFQH